MAPPALASSPTPARRSSGRPATRRPQRTGRRSAQASARPRTAGRKPAPRHPIRFAQPAAAGAAQAAIRTAGAVRDLSDSSVIVRLTRGRAWIAVLGTLLAGIVALNVFILSLNAGAGLTAQKIEALERENSALEAELAEKLSSVRVEEQATALGMQAPAPEDTSYLKARKSNVKRALEALGP
jgi:hypothetical protein